MKDLDSMVLSNGEVPSETIGDTLGLRMAIEDLASQLCPAADGVFDFAVNVASDDETVGKLQRLVNFVIDAARCGLAESEAKIEELESASHALAESNTHLQSEIVQRKQVEKTLRVREAKFSAMLMSALDPTFMIDSRGIIQHVSRSVEQCFGWKAEELIGRNISLLVPEPHRSQHDQYLENYLRTGQEHILGNVRQLNAVRRDGTTFPCELCVWKIAVTADSEVLFVGAVRDITVRRQAENEIQSLARFPSENPNPVLRVDFNGLLIYSNDAANELLACWNCRQGEKVPADLCSQIENAVGSGMNQWIDVSCGERIYSLTLAPVISSGYVCLYGRDITLLKRVENELREAKRAAEAADHSKSEFLANMSHEIRTPMTAILGFSDVLAGKVTDPESIDAIETIRRNGEHLLEIINGILDLSKIEAGKVEIEHINCSVCRIVADVASLMRIRADAKGLSLDIEFRGMIPESIRTDLTRLRQILINLIGNAVKFTETGGIQLVTTMLDADSSEPQLQFNVIDTGIGISTEAMANVFRPFTQADASTTRRFGGTGLGLSICKRLAWILGGDIAVSSTSGEGSTFSLTVATGSCDGVRMLENPTEAILAPRKRSGKPVQSATNIDCRILLAEDGPDNQRLIAFILKKAGADVTVAENGQIAVDQARIAESRDEPFDLILMDMQMPVLDGYEATGQLRQEGYTMPIIALTAHAMQGDRQKCIDAGCDDYATKPIDRETLIRMIAAYVAQARITNQSPPGVTSA